MKKISILCLLLCCTTVKAVDSDNFSMDSDSTMDSKNFSMDSENLAKLQQLEMAVHDNYACAHAVDWLKRYHLEKLDKIISNSDSLRFVLDHQDVIGCGRLIMAYQHERALGEFADLLLEPQFRDNIDNILTLEKKKQKKDSLLPYDVRKISGEIGDIAMDEDCFDCLTDATLPVALHSFEAYCLWSCLDNPGRQTLYTCYKNNRVLSDLSYDVDGTLFDDFIKTWETGLTAPGGPFEKGMGFSFRYPEHRKIINDYFHEHFSDRDSENPTMHQ